MKSLFLPLVIIILLAAVASAQVTCSEECDAKIKRLELRLDLMSGDWKKPGNNFAYSTSEDKMTWLEADQYCKDRNSQLAASGPRDRHIINYLSGTLLRGVGNAWIGLNDRESEGDFVWIDDGQGTIYWNREEPNGGRGENCGMLYNSEPVVNDNGCSDKWYALCEIPLS